MRLLLLTFALALIAGCQPVEAWQRDILARPEMALDPLVLESQRRQHVQQSREAGSIAGGAAGGGCGCY